MTMTEKIHRAAKLLENCALECEPRHQHFIPLLKDLTSNVLELEDQINEYDKAWAPRSIPSFGPEYKFISDSQDIEPIHEYTKDAIGFDSFFVKINDYGDYAEAWGMLGKIPYNNKTAYRVI